MKAPSYAVTTAERVEHLEHHEESVLGANLILQKLVAIRRLVEKDFDAQSAAKTSIVH